MRDKAWDEVRTKEFPHMIEEMKGAAKSEAFVAYLLTYWGKTILPFGKKRYTPDTSEDNIKKYSDWGDLYCTDKDGYVTLVEVKKQKEKSGNWSENNFPFKVVIIDGLAQWEKKKVRPNLYIVVNKDYTAIQIIDCKMFSEEDTFIKNFPASNNGEMGTKDFLCLNYPHPAIKFYSLNQELVSNFMNKWEYRSENNKFE